MYNYNNKMNILSFNILAQRYYKDNIFNWNTRLNKILEILNKKDIEIICLQEVEIETFKNDFIQLFDKYDFIGHEIIKKRNSPIGNYILYKKEFKLIEFKTTSSSCIVILKFNNKLIKIANVHLKADIYKIESINTRINQLKSVINYKPDIICGDFNDDFNNELGKFINDNNYISHNTKNTCYASYDNIYSYWNFDNILTKTNSIIKNISIHSLFTLIDQVIPNENIPSDHIPIIFEIEFEKN